MVALLNLNTAMCLINILARMLCPLLLCFHLLVVYNSFAKVMNHLHLYSVAHPWTSSHVIKMSQFILVYLLLQKELRETQQRLAAAEEKLAELESADSELQKLRKDQEDLLELLTDQDTRLNQLKAQLRALGEKASHTFTTSWVIPIPCTLCQWRVFALFITTLSWRLKWIPPEKW